MPEIVNMDPYEPEAPGPEKVAVLFGFLRKVGQFINRTANRILGRADVAVQSERLVGLATADHLTPLAVSLAEGTTTLPAWQAAMRSNIKHLYVDQYVMGRGGKAMMTQQDYGRLSQMLQDQYKYLDRYAIDLSKMDVLEREAYIRNRSQLYANASNEAFERGRSAAAQSLGMDEVNWNRTPAESCQSCIDREAMGPQPAGPRGGFPSAEGESWPADGTTICRCITSPESPVLTKRGWMPMLDVKVGDEVWTHKERWRPVLAFVTKPSVSGDSEVTLNHLFGAKVSSTSGHLWFTKTGWVPASSVDKLVHLSGRQGTTIFMNGALPEDTAVYDLTVEEDHSFCIAGFYAHNTNCKCYLSYSNSETGQEWEA